MAVKKIDKKELDAYKKVLLKMKEEIVRDIKNMSKIEGANKDDAGDVSGHALHMADVATDMYDREFTLGLASNERELLNKIDDALKSIEDKTYGICVECQCSITKARIKAIPYVKTCRKCQEKIESMK